ncbi:hypothetical protein RI367_002769 [Sorochytrium milnesiophthora]
MSVAWSARFGDAVILRDAQTGCFQSDRGILKHQALVGRAARDVVETHNGNKFTLHRPTLDEYILRAPRTATPIYPKDAYAILQLLDLSPSDQVLECGTGTGSLTLHMARYLDVDGRIVSIDVRQKHTDHARAFVERFFSCRINRSDASGDRAQQIEFITADLPEYLGRLDPATAQFDAVVLDMMNPWEVFERIACFLRRDGVMTIRDQQLPFAMERCIEVEHKEWDIRPVSNKWSKTDGVAPLAAAPTDWVCRPKNYDTKSRLR